MRWGGGEGEEDSGQGVGEGDGQGGKQQGWQCHQEPHQRSLLCHFKKVGLCPEGDGEPLKDVHQ